MNVSIVPALKVLKPAAMIAVVTVLGLVVGYWANAALSPGTSPEQPIAFSHKIHAGDNEIPCMYCHTEAAPFHLGRRTERPKMYRLP